MEIEEEYKVPSLIKSYGPRIILPQIYRGKMIPKPNRLKICVKSMNVRKN